MFNGAPGIWKLAHGITFSTIRKQMEYPLSIVLIGDADSVRRLSDRLGGPTALIVRPGESFNTGPDTFVFDSKELVDLPEGEFVTALTNIARSRSDRQIALANNIPAFRPFITRQLSHDRSLENAKIAAISALPGILPLTDWLMPATAAGDMLILTRNQIVLLLEVAACYGKPPEVKDRLKELLPVIGSAFGWRAIARELVGLVPGGVGVAVKAAIAYSGTYAIGRAAAYYYSGGNVQTSAEQLQSFYKNALVEGYSRAKSLVVRGD